MAPRREKLKAKSKLDWSDEQRNWAAARVTYRGSPEHKTSPSPAGAFHPRAGNSLCPPALADARGELTQWLRAAISDGLAGAPLLNGFPRHAWARQGEQWFEARLTNEGNGEYKGWPVDEDELPGWWRKG